MTDSFQQAQHFKHRHSWLNKIREKDRAVQYKNCNRLRFYHGTNFAECCHLCRKETRDSFSIYLKYKCLKRQIKIFWSNLTGSGWWWPVRGRSFCPGQNPSNWDSQWRCCCCSNSDQNSDNKYIVDYMTNTFLDYITNTFSGTWLLCVLTY